MSKKSKRPGLKPLPEFASRFQAAYLELSTHFLATNSFQHGLTKGEEREKPVLDFIKSSLPSIFSVASGEVIDPFGTHSPQLDVMIYDGSRNIPVYEGGAIILPAEALLATFEVKSKLTKQEITKSLRAATSLKALKPFKRKLLDGGREDKTNGKDCRYFYTVFAYDSDLAKDDWLEKENNRISSAADEDDALSSDVLDRVYVAGRGLISPNNRFGISEDETDAKALMALIMHTMNFVIRENKNRKDAPYDQYSGQLTVDLQRL